MPQARLHSGRVFVYIYILSRHLIYAEVPTKFVEMQSQAYVISNK
jgi:hypothetical protein